MTSNKSKVAGEQRKHYCKCNTTNPKHEPSPDFSTSTECDQTHTYLGEVKCIRCLQNRSSEVVSQCHFIDPNCLDCLHRASTVLQGKEETTLFKSSWSRGHEPMGPSFNEDDMKMVVGMSFGVLLCLLIVYCVKRWSLGEACPSNWNTTATPEQPACEWMLKNCKGTLKCDFDAGLQQ